MRLRRRLTLARQRVLERVLDYMNGPPQPLTFEEFCAAVERDARAMPIEKLIERTDSSKNYVAFLRSQDPNDHRDEYATAQCLIERRVRDERFISEGRSEQVNRAAARKTPAGEQSPREPAPQPEPARPRPHSVLNLSDELRARHVYIIGTSGMGKTTLLKHLIVEDLERGAGCAFLDPHGDAALELLGLVPRDCIEDVFYFDPTSSSAPAFNLLALPYDKPKLAVDITSAFKMLFGSSWGPQLEQLLRTGLLTLLLDREPHALKDLETLLVRPDYRDEIVRRSPSEPLRDFWVHVFPTLGKGAVNPVLNKLSALLVPTSDLERVFSSTTNALDFPAMMDNGRVFIANLAKGKLGDESSRLLGALLATAIQQAALARADRPREERRPFYFYVDEFQDYAVSSFATILSEARKYNVGLTLANQWLAQLPSELQHAVFGAATLIAFHVTTEDAPRLTRELHSSRVRICSRDTGRYWTLEKFTTLVHGSLALIRKHYVEASRSCMRQFSHAASSASVEDGDQFLFGQFADRVRQIDNAAERFSGSVLSTDDLRAICAFDLDAIDYQKAPVPIGMMLMNNPDDFIVQRSDEPPSSFQYHEKRLRPFIEFDIREESYPTLDELVNLKPLTAYVRIERPENVSELTLSYAPAPDLEIRAAILARMDALKRASSPPPERPPPRAPEQAPSPAGELAPPMPPVPKPDDDFTF